MELRFSWQTASFAAGLAVAASCLLYLPEGTPIAVGIAESCVLIAPLCLRMRESRAASTILLLYGVAWAGLAAAGAISYVVLLPALCIILWAATRLSFRLGAASNGVLHLYSSLPPGRYAAKRSRFLEAYVSNSFVVAAVACLLLALMTRAWVLVAGTAALAFCGAYVAFLRDDSSRAFESELPFLMILASFYSSAGHRGIEAALESISSTSTRVFKGLGLARLTFLHERLYSSPTPAKTLSRFATRQKDSSLIQVVDGYRTVSATGGDAYAYLVEQTDRSLARFEDTRLAHVRTTRSIAEVLLLTLALAPSVALTISVIGLNGSLTLYVLAISLPFAAFLALTLVDLYLPPIRDQIGFGWGLPLGLGASAIVMFFTRSFSSVPLSLTAASVAFLLPLSVQYQLDTNAARRDERESLRTFSSLVESLRIGKSVHEALEEAASNVRSEAFAGHLREFGTQIGLGVPPPEAGARVSSKSWVTRASFVIMGHAMVLGGGLEIVERFRTFLTRYVDSWTSVRREALWTAALSASLPFVTLGGVSVITSLEGSFASTAEQPALLVSLQVLPLQSVLLAFVEVSALAAVLASKLAGLTIKATPVALATMAATLVSLIVYGLA